MSPSGIEPATLRLVVQCLSQVCYRLATFLTLPVANNLSSYPRCVCSGVTSWPYCCWKWSRNWIIVFPAYPDADNNSFFRWGNSWCHTWFRSTKKKVKVTLVQALRLCTGRTAHRGSRGIALLFHDQRHWKGVRGQRHVPAVLYPRERPGTYCTGGWVGPRAGLGRCGKSRSHRDSIPGPSSP